IGARPSPLRLCRIVICMCRGRDSPQAHNTSAPPCTVDSPANFAPLPPPLLPLMQGGHDKTKNSVTSVPNRHHACRGRGSPQGHNTSTPVDSPTKFPPPLPPCRHWCKAATTKQRTP
ncbi:unnamed protein product, partial [Ectocarpus sp. 12 AP-2014]